MDGQKERNLITGVGELKYEWCCGAASVVSWRGGAGGRSRAEGLAKGSCGGRSRVIIVLLYTVIIGEKVSQRAVARKIVQGASRMTTRVLRWVPTSQLRLHFLALSGAGEID